jgi:hypothetical protein
MDKFKLIAFAIVGVFAIGLIVGFVVLESTGRPTSSFIIFAGSILTSLGIFGGLGYGQVKQSEQLATIKTQTNGTLSAEREENRRLVALLMEKHGVDPAQLTEIAPKSIAAAESAGPDHRAEVVS